MPLICPHCGGYALTNEDRSPDSLRCSACHQTTAANILPLFIVTGASGSGKTSVIPELRLRLPQCVVLDKDLLWGRAAEGQFANNWLRIAYGVAQGGRHTVICGTLMPHDLDACQDRGLVGAIHFANLHCADDVRARRLRERPAWRQASSDAFIAEHRRFARWLLDHVATAFDPPMPTIDTSESSPAEAAAAIAAWVESVLGDRPPPQPAPDAPGA